VEYIEQTFPGAATLAGPRDNVFEDDELQPWNMLRQCGPQRLRHVAVDDCCDLAAPEHWGEGLQAEQVHWHIGVRYHAGDAPRGRLDAEWRCVQYTADGTIEPLRPTPLIETIEHARPVHYHCSRRQRKAGRHTGQRCVHPIALGQ